MKLSDYVAEFIEKMGTEYVFALTGGAVTHLIDSVAQNSNLNYVCNLHEQATAMAADAYARMTGKIGVAMVTSGPGATNLLTGCCSSFYESVPVMFITGQVSVGRMKGEMKVRQLGFQETAVCDIYNPVTKYVITITEPEQIQYELEKAYHYAMEGRKGPVLIDIPDDIQRAEVNPDKMSHFFAEERVKEISNADIKKCTQYLNESKRPVFIVGWGVRSSGFEREMKELIEYAKIPTIFTWAGLDLLPYNHSLNFGTFGVNGGECGNFAIKHADLIISIGARLNTKHRGTSADNFAPNAKKIVIDIDQAELEKFSALNFEVDALIEEDAGTFIKFLLEELREEQYKGKVMEWLEQLNKIKNVKKTFEFQYSAVNPYLFIQKLSTKLPAVSTVIGDTGCTVVWTMQALQLKAGQRCFSSFNHTPMGYALPASIGASYAARENMVVCITGDGGFQMNMQELGTIIHNQRNIKIIIFDNQGYSMIRNAQKKFLQGRLAATENESGVCCPDYIKIAKAYGYKTVYIQKNEDIDEKLEEVLNNSQPIVCVIRISKEMDILI